MIVLDTNVLSEAMKASPSPQVMRWLGQYPASRLFTTTITQAEILHGVEILPRGKRRSAFERATEAMFAQDFAGRVLPFDSEAAQAFPQIARARRNAGRPMTGLDTEIAAIALARGASVATRNTADFDDCGIVVLNPWTERV